MRLNSYRFTREWKRLAQPLAIVGMVIWGVIFALVVANLEDRVPWFKALVTLGLIYGGAYFCFIGLWFRKRPERIRIDGVARCIACQYPAEATFERCPECGADLRRSGAVVLGVPKALGHTGALFLVSLGMCEIGIALYLWLTW